MLLLKITAMSKLVFRLSFFLFFFFFFSFHVGGIKNVFNCSCTTSRTGKWEDKGSTPVGRTRMPVSLTFMDLFWKYFDKLVLSKARF